MNFLKTFENYSDDDLESLKDFGKSYGIIKRRVLTEDLEFGKDVKDTENEELDFLDAWKGEGGERVEEVSGYLIGNEMDLDISLDNGYHVRFDAMLPTSPSDHNWAGASIKIYGPGIKITPEKQAGVLTRFIEYQTDKGTFESILTIYEELKH